MSIAQENAVELLLLGRSDQEVADAVGVVRQTVWGWRHKHPGVRAALNARRAAAWGASVDRLRSLVPLALETIDESLRADPDPKLAIEVLKLVGLSAQGLGANLGAYDVGPADPGEIVDAEVRARRRDDLLEQLVEGGPVSDRERAAVAGELLALAAGDG